MAHCKFYKRAGVQERCTKGRERAISYNRDCVNCSNNNSRCNNQSDDDDYDDSCDSILDIFESDGDCNNDSDD